MRVREEDRRVVLAGASALVGGIVGATLAGGIAWAGWAVLTGPHEGWDAFDGLTVAFSGGLLGSLPGGLVGVWLAVRRAPGARATIGYAAAALPAAAVLLFGNLLGFGFVGFGSGLQPFAWIVLFGIGSGARALALRGVDQALDEGSQ